MDVVYKLGFTGVMLLGFLYLLWEDQEESRFLVRVYTMSFAILSAIFVVAHMNAPHHIYQGLPRGYPLQTGRRDRSSFFPLPTAR